MRSLVAVPAIVLRMVAYGESDRVVTLLGLSTGKVGALARGARRSTRRFPGLGVGVRGEAHLRERGGDLMILENFESTRGSAQIVSDLARVAHTAYALELVDRLIAPRHGEEAVFHWLDEMLERIETGKPRAERLRVFELGLLQRLGLAPVLDHCAVCGRTDLGTEAMRWAPEIGGTVCRNCGGRGTPLPAPARQAMLALSSLTLAQSEDHNLVSALNDQCRDALMEFMKLHTGGPLRSVEFIAKLGAT